MHPDDPSDRQLAPAAVVAALGFVAPAAVESAVPATDMNSGPGPVTDDTRADAQAQAESTNLHPRTE